MSGTIWPAQIKQVCVKMAREGFNPSQIHTATGVPRQTIITWLERDRSATERNKIGINFHNLVVECDVLKVDLAAMTAERDALKTERDNANVMLVQSDRRWANEREENRVVHLANQELATANDALKVELGRARGELAERDALKAKSAAYKSELKDYAMTLTRLRIDLAAKDELIKALNSTPAQEELEAPVAILQNTIYLIIRKNNDLV